VSRASRVYFAACAGLIGFALLYALPIYARLPRTFYDPVARRWHWASNLGPIPMGYVGQILWGIGGGAACALVASLIASTRKAEPEERTFGLWAAWALTAVLVVLGYFTWNNWP
jgi:hypothetical protein